MEAMGMKRSLNDEEDDEVIGPVPEDFNKKAKVMDFERVYLDSIPNAEGYEKSYMHRDVIVFVEVSKTDFIMTASVDGHVKFWKKNEGPGIEFVKHFRAHMGNIVQLCMSSNGEYAATISDDKCLKVFDVGNFDMINMLRLPFVPKSCSWLYASGDPIAAIAVADSESEKIYVYDGRGAASELHTIEVHMKPVTIMKYNAVYDTLLSVSEDFMVEYIGGPKNEYKMPKSIQWEYKTDTDLYEFAKLRTKITSLAFSPNGKLFVTFSSDRKIRLFKFLTGKMTKVIDENIQVYSEMQQEKQQIPNMEFGRRMATEREMEKADHLQRCNIIFDESGNYILYATIFGIKVVNIQTNRCVRFIGKPENARFLHISMFQGTAIKPKAAMTAEMHASENPSLQPGFTDPTIFCTAFKKNRFYLFSRREPTEDPKSADSDRDVFNEKPSKEELVAATQETAVARLASAAVIHTTLGDIGLKLFPSECPKAVENFVVHSRNSYYNGHCIHRVIPSFMFQMGDPLGNGTGGESIWGHDFEDEFEATLRHDRPYTLSMANAGPNTNGSQFFITVVPTPWLDNKHTVFGRVVRGMEVCENISHVKTDKKTDKPLDEIRIVNISIH